jgi:hypothetical protein
MLVTVNLAPEHWQEYEKRGMPSPTKKVDAAGAWCKRLAKLTGCTSARAETIAAAGAIFRDAVQEYARENYKLLHNTNTL